MARFANILLLLVVVCYFQNVYCIAMDAGSSIRAVSIFRADESDLHKYSAVLAATEPIRIRCDNEIKRAMNPFAYVYHFVKRTKLKDPNGVIRVENKGVDQACSRFENRVDEVLRSYGMSSETFNSISYRMKNDSFMKQRILLQAYFYRIAADLESNINATPLLPMSSTSHLRIPVNAGAGSRRAASGAGSKNRYLLYGSSRFERFCYALYEVEAERLRQREDLQYVMIRDEDDED